MMGDGGRWWERWEWCGSGGRDGSGRSGGSGGRVWERGEGVGAVGGCGSGGRVWERWEGVGAVGDSPRTPEGGQAASGGTNG